MKKRNLGLHSAVCEDVLLMDSFEEDINKVRFIGTVQNFIFSSFPHLSLKQCIKLKIILRYSWCNTDKGNRRLGDRLLPTPLGLPQIAHRPAKDRTGPPQ
jgi:hypothetical protein